MGYKESLLQQIKVLREYQELRQKNIDEAYKIENIVKVAEASHQVGNFFSSLNKRKLEVFGGDDGYRDFIARHQQLLQGNKFPEIKYNEYGQLTLPDVDYEAILNLVEKEGVAKEAYFEDLYKQADSKYKEYGHPMTEIVNAIKADADRYFEENVANEIKSSLDYADGEMIEKTGDNLLEKAFTISSNLPGLKASAGFTDYVKSQGMDENVIVNFGGEGSITGYTQLEENIPTYKEFTTKELQYDDQHKQKILGLDRLLREQGLLMNAAGGESGNKEYGLTDYTNVQYALKKALTDHAKLTSDEEKKNNLIKIHQLTEQAKDVTSRYEKVFNYIKENFDLEHMNFSGNVYGGRGQTVEDGNIDAWHPNLPPKFDFENSPEVIFLNGFTQLKAACQHGNVGLEEYLEHPIKSYFRGAKLQGELNDRKYYLPREGNSFGKRLAHVLVTDDAPYNSLAGYAMAGGRGMEFIANTAPDKENQVPNTIISGINKDYASLYDHNPIRFFGDPFSPQMDNIKRLFAFAPTEDNLYKASSHYVDEKCERLQNASYLDAVKRQANTPVADEYRRIMEGFGDFARERKYINDHEADFVAYNADGQPGELSVHSLGTVLYAGREYFLDYLKENNLSIDSIEDAALREEIRSFVQDPAKVMFDKYVKGEDMSNEGPDGVRATFRECLNKERSNDARAFFDKFRETVNKPGNRYADKSFATIVSENKGGFFERWRGLTSKQYSHLQKIAKDITKPESPVYGDDKALYLAAKDYRAFKLPEGANFDHLSSTAKKRIGFCDAIIEAYEAKERAKQAENEAANQPVENAQNNIIQQDEFQQQLGNDLAADNEIKVEVAPKENNVNEKDPPDEGIEP